MKSKDVHIAAKLCDADKELPKVRRRLRDKPRPDSMFEEFMLELSAAEMVGGEGQGSEAYLYLPPDLGEKVLDFAQTLIRAELKRLGVETITGDKSIMLIRLTHTGTRC